MNPNENLLLTLWDLENGKVVRTFGGGPTQFTSFTCFSPDGSRALAGGYDGALRLWDLETGKELRRLEGGEKQQLPGVAFSPDGKQVASTGQAPGKDKQGRPNLVPVIRLWDADTGKELRSLTGHTARIDQIWFTADGRRLVSSGFDMTFRLWDVQTGQELGAWPNLLSFGGGAVLPDGRHLLSAGHDGQLRLWKIPVQEKK